MPELKKLSIMHSPKEINEFILPEVIKILIGNSQQFNVGEEFIKNMKLFLPAITAPTTWRCLTSASVIVSPKGIEKLVITEINKLIVSFHLYYKKRMIAVVESVWDGQRIDITNLKSIIMLQNINVCKYCSLPIEDCECGFSKKSLINNANGIIDIQGISGCKANVDNDITIMEDITGMFSEKEEEEEGPTTDLHKYDAMLEAVAVKFRWKKPDKLKAQKIVEAELKRNPDIKENELFMQVVRGMGK